MSLCDSCFAPGACCKRLTFYGGRPNPDGSNVSTFWLDMPIDDQLRTRRPSEDFDRPMPFRPVKPLGEWIDEASGRPIGSFVFTCTNLTPEGRCGDYENRPWLCRHFPAGEDPLCVHYRGAEGGEHLDFDWREND